MTAKQLIASSPGEAASRAKEECANGPVVNLIISFPIDLQAPAGDFLATYREQAALWQEPIRPNVLHFSHGEYMHAYGDPIEYLVNELKSKPSSNRALVVLVDTKPIVTSGDGQLPSFMLLQVGFQGSGRDILYVTSYYRALEVSKFLPINMAEMGLIAEGVAARIPSIERADVTMHAFRAHVLNEFRTHRRSRLDMAAPTRIHVLVRDRRLEDLANMLVEKSTPESIVEDSGLTTLRTELEDSGWAEGILLELDRAISALTRLRTARESGTHERLIAHLQDQLTTHLTRSAELIKASDTRRK